MTSKPGHGQQWRPPITFQPCDQEIRRLFFENKLLVIGGESATQTEAHNEVEAFNPKTQKWERLPSLHQGRHGTQAVLYNKKIYIAAGSANQGNGPELNDMEILEK
jgi:N-acetylneuraminic acid mutarotase